MIGALIRNLFEHASFQTFPEVNPSGPRSAQGDTPLLTAIPIGCWIELNESFNLAADPDEKNAEVFAHARG